MAGLACVYIAATAVPGIAQSGSSLQWFLNLSLAFAMGVGAYVLRQRFLVSVWVLAGIASVLALCAGSPIERPLSAVFVGYAAIWLSQFRFGPLRSWANMVDLSFGIYIYGWVVQQCVVATLPELGPIANAGTTFVILLPIAALSWFLVEKPSLGLRPVITRWFDDRMGRGVTAHQIR